MTRPTLLKIICGLALLYSIMWVHEQDYVRQTTEPDEFERIVADADRQAEINRRYGK